MLNTSMKKVIVLLSFVFACVFSFAQKTGSQGIGLRLGDPVGLTYKKYIDKSKAFEFILGTAAPGWRNGYYHNSFDFHDDFNDYRYRTHEVQSSISFQGRLQFHHNIYIQGMEGKWDWYWGVGGVLRLAKVRYSYDDGGTIVRETYNDFDLGPDGIGGMEYTFENVPISVFAEVSLMLEIVDRLTLQPLSGAGARFRF
jgi:hypothetical protein